MGIDPKNEYKIALQEFAGFFSISICIVSKNFYDVVTFDKLTTSWKSLPEPSL
jgi:hypothetical protein